MHKHNSTKTYHQLVKGTPDKQLTTLVQLGTIAEHHRTEIAHAMMRAIINAKYNGSRYGWK